MQGHRTVQVSSPARAVDSHPLAFDVEPSKYRFRLRLSRRQALGETLARFAGSANSRNGPIQLLDLGVGRGASRRYVEKHPRAGCIEWFGVDISWRRLSSVYDYGSWNLIRADLEYPVPFAPLSFDVVVCEQVLEHLSDPGGLIQDTYRLLKPGGLLIAGVPVFPPGLCWIRRHVVPFIDAWTGSRRAHVQTFSLSDFKKLIGRGNRFVIESVRGFRFVSGGPLRPLENFRWWWQLNRALGARLPGWCIEVQILAIRI